MLTWFLLLFLVLLLLNFPVYLTFYISALFALFVYLDKIPIEIVIQTSFNQVNVYALVAVPFFIFTASIMSKGGMAKRLIDWAMSLVGSIKGSLGVATTLSAIFFGALSGSAPATVAALGKMIYPSLLENKYGKNFSLGLLASGGGIALLIPPSITMIIYGSIANASVGKLFIAGILPGLLVGLCFIIYTIFYAIKHDLPTTGKFSFKKAIDGTVKAAWTLGVPIIILGGIYTGIFTPTESAAISSVYAIFVSMVIYKEMNFKDLWNVAAETVELTAQIFLIVAASGIFSWLLTIGKAPQILTEYVTNSDMSYVAIMLSINLILFIAGMFMHPTSITIIFTPLFAPVLNALGVDLIHFGMILTVNIAIAMYSPPFGLNLFVAAGVFKEPLSPIIKGVLPFLFLSIIALMIVTFVPQVSLFLPNLMN